MWEHPAVIVSFIGLLINLFVTVIGGIWKLSRMELALSAAINEAADKTDVRIERQERYFGETVSAVRQKIAEVELFCRDTFARKDEGRSELKQLGDRINLRLASIENKLENLK